MYKSIIRDFIGCLMQEHFRRALLFIPRNVEKYKEYFSEAFHFTLCDIKALFSLVFREHEVDIGELSPRGILSVKHTNDYVIMRLSVLIPELNMSFVVTTNYPRALAIRKKGFVIDFTITKSL